MALQDEKLSLASLTGGEAQGAGAFDELMRAVNSHIQVQFDAGRLTEENIAQVYLGALQTTMSEGSNFLIKLQESNQRVRLMDEEIANSKLQGTLLQAQIDKIAKETLGIEKQTLKLDSDIALVDTQVILQGKQGEVLDEAVLNAQKDLLVKDSQIANQDAQTTMVGKQIINTENQAAQILIQTTKISAEKDILTQRAVSEEAQTKDVVGGIAVGGIIGKQMSLYQNQADGYIRDAEQKAAKIMNDTLITRISTDYEQVSTLTAGLSDAEVGNVMSKLKLGIGA
jgi:hypothetical protein